MKISVALFTLLCVVHSAKLPSTFKKCDRKDSNFNECLREAVEGAIRQLDQPKKEANLVGFEPLEIPSMVIGAGTAAVSLTQNYKDVKLFGYTKLSCSKLSMDFEKKILTMDCVVPEVRMQFHYKVNGKILLLPVYGDGPGTITLEKMKFMLEFGLEDYEKNGQKHFKVVKNKFLMDPQKITYNFENLFNGDKALGDNINNVMNDNWKEVFTDVQKSYEDAFGQVFASVFNNLLSKFSISELFGEE